MSPSLAQDDATLAVRDRKWISKCIESLNEETAFLAKIVLIMFKENRKKKKSCEFGWPCTETGIEKSVH